MTLFGNKDVAFYLSNAQAQTHDLTAFLTLNLKTEFALCRFNLSTIGNDKICVVDCIACERDRMWIDSCGSASKNIQIKRVVGAAVALRWEKEKQVQEKNNIQKIGLE